MPLDPRIPLGVQPPQIQNPLEVMSTVAQLQAMREQTEARRLAAEEAREKAKDAAAVRQILTETGGDMEKALPRLRAIAPKAALDFEQTIEQTKKEKFAAATNQMTARGKELEFAASMASLVADNPALAPVVRERLQRISAEITPLLPTSDDPADWGKFSQVTLTAKERYERSQANLKLFGEGKLQEALGRGLSTATSGEEWDKTIQGFRDIGGPQQIADLFGGKGAFSPENVARAAQLAQPPAKPGAAANLQQKDLLLDGKPATVIFNPDTGQSFQDTPAGRVDVSTRVRPIPPPNPLQLVSVVGPDGKPRLVRESAAEGQMPGSAAAEAGGALPPRIETTVRGLAGAFRNEAAVKRTTTMAEAVNFVQGLSSTTRNPADDQGLIYAFAKAMDPESVVREGEYATVQKYATSWLERFGFDAMRVLSSDTPILTTKARDNLKATIRSRFQASRGQYDNLFQSYTSQINKVTGNTDGADRLTDYAAAFPMPDAAGGGAAGAPRVRPPAAGGTRAAPSNNPFKK